jgi:hypothetical protein
VRGRSDAGGGRPGRAGRADRPGARLSESRAAAAADSRAAAAADWQDPTRARTPETPRVSCGPGRPDSESEPGPGPSPIGRPYDSDSSKGHWHDPPTLLVRAAPGADSARPGEPERRDARNITEISEIIREHIAVISANISRKKNYRRLSRGNISICPKF